MGKAVMQVCLAVLSNPAAKELPEEFLQRTVIYLGLPQALARLGHEVTVVVQFPSSAAFVEEGVRYYFQRSRIWERAASAVAGVMRQRRSRWEPATGCISLIRDLMPDVIHFYGFDLHLNLRLLLKGLEAARTRVLLHYHGGEPSESRIGSRMQRDNFQKVDRFLFPTSEQAQPYVRAGLVPAHKVVPFFGTASEFVMRPREPSRALTGIHGRPVFVWTGRLHPVKDPLTALKGFAKIVRQWPEARLYMFYRTDELLGKVKRLIRAVPELDPTVFLCGSIDAEHMESVYNSADFFLQTSTREVSGFALAEAMACGAVPVVTDIPSFRAATNGGGYGILVPPGDPQALASAVLKTNLANIPAWSLRIRTRLEKTLSFPAQADQLTRLYADLS